MSNKTSNTHANYSIAYEHCAKVVKDNVLKYPLDVFELIKSYDIKTIPYSKLVSKYNCASDIAEFFSNYGFLLRDRNTNRAIIYYNDSLPLETIRFTLLHELAHYLMNHFVDSKTNDNIANCFARNLLAPANLCVQLGLKTHDKIARYFKMSCTAAKVRLDFLRCDLYYIEKLPYHPVLYYIDVIGLETASNPPH